MGIKSKYQVQIHHLVQTEDLPTLSQDLRVDFKDICESVSTVAPLTGTGLLVCDRRKAWTGQEFQHGDWMIAKSDCHRWCRVVAQTVLRSYPVIDQLLYPDCSLSSLDCLGIVVLSATISATSPTNATIERNASDWRGLQRQD